MWDDEASVVWFAKNYNQHGKILGYDGEHLFSYRNGQLINNELVYNNPPLDIYYAAFIIRHFGESDFILRFSFALLGFVALGLFVWCFRLITEKDKIWFVFSSSILILSVNYLLIEANTRYYALTFLFAAISLLAALKIVEKPEKKYTQKVMLLTLQLSAIYLLFLSHYLAAVCWWLMCGIILLQHQQIRISLKDKFTNTVALLYLLLFAIIVHYIISEQVLHRPDLENEDGMLMKYSKLLQWLFEDLHRLNIIPLWLIPAFIILLFSNKHLISKSLSRLIMFLGVFLIAIVALNPQPTSHSLSFDIRYLYVVIPVLYLLMGYFFKLLYEQVKWGKIISIVLAVIFINSTLLSAIPSDGGPQLLLPNFIKERMNPFPTAYSEAIHYIHKNFKEKKKILTLPGFHNTVFFRYVPEKIQVTNTLNEKTDLSKHLIDSLGQQCLYIGNCKPEYVFQFGSTETLEDYPFKASDFKFIDTILIYAHGVDVSRPELYWHSFGPKKINDTSLEALYIFHD